MKKMYNSILAILFLGIIGTVNAQVSTYAFSQNNGVYTPLVGGISVSASNTAIPDDNVYGNLPIGFTFTYNGVAQTAVGLNVNGWISMGSVTPTSNYTPLSSGTINNIIAGIGRDLQLSVKVPSCAIQTGSATVVVPTATLFSVGDVIYGSTGMSATGSTITAISGNSLTITPNATGTSTTVMVSRKGNLSYATTGIAPNRIFTIEWDRVSRYSTTPNDDNISFQIRLKETSNIVEVLYGPVVFGTTANTAQVGLRGNSNADFNNRSNASGSPWATNVAGTLNTASLAMINTSTVLNGLNFVWTPVSPCSGAPAAGIANPASIGACIGSTVGLTSTGTTLAPGITYQWQVSATSGGPYSNVVGGSGATTTAYNTATLSAGTYYYVLVTTCTISSTSATSSEATVAINPVPTASASNSSPVCAGQNVNFTGGSNIGTSFLWSGPNSFTANTQNPTISAATANASGLYTMIASAGGCNSLPVTTTVQVNANPTTITVTPTSTLFCGAGSSTVSASGGLVPTTMNAGTNTNTNTATTYPSPYSVYWGGQRMQFLVLASELSAAGFVANSPLNSLQFPVVSKGANWGTTITDNKNFQINIGTTTLTALNSFQTGLVNVLAATNYSPVVGYGNVHNFSTPFIWDGTSNVILESTFSNNLAGVSADAVFTYTTATSFSSTVIYRADNTAAAAIATGTVVNEGPFMARPDFKLNGLSIGTFSWSPSASLSASTGSLVTATPTTSTIYTVTVASGLCSTKATVSMSVVPVPTVNITSSSASVCAGSSSTLTANGAANYVWNTSATTPAIVVTPTAGTTYTVTGSNGPGCNDTKTVSVSVNALPIIAAASTSSLLCVGQSAALFVTGTSATYTWNTGANTTSISVSPSVTTVYTVTGSSAAGCTASTTVTQSVSTCIGIENLTAVNDGASVFPNPSNGFVNVVISDLSLVNVIEVYDATGRLVIAKELSQAQTTISTIQLSNGIYSYRIKNNSGIVKQGKLVKE